MCFHIVNYGAFVYRLGRCPFKAERPVRFWYGVPWDCGEIGRHKRLKISRFRKGYTGSIPVSPTKFLRRVAARRILKRPVELAGVLNLSRYYFR